MGRVVTWVLVLIAMGGAGHIILGSQDVVKTTWLEVHHLWKKFGEIQTNRGNMGWEKGIGGGECIQGAGGEWDFQLKGGTKFENANIRRTYIRAAG